jgi:hypothetical protein
MNRSKIQIVATISVVIVLLGAVMIVVQLGAVVSAQEGTAVAGAISPLLQYQGRLSDPSSGEPVEDGSHTMVFRLYTGPSGGTALWTEAKDVPVQGGLFSTALGDTTPLSQDLFTGQALWLGIKVGADEEATPRQQMLPVVYALSLVPGASIQANSSSAALNLSNAGSGQALHAGGPVVVDGDLTVNGSLSGSHAADADAHHTRYTDAEAVDAWLLHPESVTQYEYQDHVYYASAHHDRYTDAEAMSSVLAADGSGSGLDADLLDGQEASDLRAMLPIAFGHINSDCNLRGATKNVTCSIYNQCYSILNQ